MNEKRCDKSKKTKDNSLIRSRRRKKILVVVLASLVVITLVFGFYLFRNAKQEPESGDSSGIMSVVEDSELMIQAKELKSSMKELAAALMKQDAAASETAREKMQKDVSDVRATLDTPFWKASSVMPVVGKEIKNVKELLNLVEDADASMIGPYIDLMRENPLSDLKAGDGIRIDVARRYLDFSEQVLPDAERILQRFHALDLSRIDRDGKIAGYAEKGEKLLRQGLEMKDYLPAIRAIFGDGSDRLFVFAAQNSSEMRASGGFPGSIGTIRIHDGIMSLSDFTSVYKVFVSTTPAAAKVTEKEDKLFSGRLHLPWDADFSPDFERVASIWAMAYEMRNGTEVDGVISATPVVIQNLLSFLGSIELSDGTILNGDNATRVLGHDLYFKYLGPTQSSYANELVDELFAECAEKTFHLMMSDFSVSHLPDYCRFFVEGIENRSIMVWMKDEEAQRLIRESGWSAGLNRDPEKPEIGIFFNSTVASKMTWFLDIEPALSDPVANEDGSLSYNLTVSLSNVISEEERLQAGSYILGGTGGITGTFFIFAPAGGTVGEFETNSSRVMIQDSYMDLQLGYQSFNIVPNEPVVVRCRITTAPGVSTQIKIVTPPLMQDYR